MQRNFSRRWLYHQVASLSLSLSVSLDVAKSIRSRVQFQSKINSEASEAVPVTVDSMYLPDVRQRRRRGSPEYSLTFDSRRVIVTHHRSRFHVLAA